ncbi:hypothetical protein DSO57_1012664 [Entomophthora muscae]|uniref:Uncharacterized protein n=1 Tax=Entomophthora muscae TaxID=34485 RepID=A0ACC2RX26_9FUNG|nr:hypothetical protein DSO57_1012664 [Entomophthora muscae]
MNHLIFTAVLTACLGIGGYQSGPELFEPSPEGLGQDSYYDPGQLNSSQTGPWPPLVSPHSTLSIAMYTFMYYILTYFAGSFGRYNVHAKIFRWLMTVYPIVTALTGFQFDNLLPYVLQVIPTITGYDTPTSGSPGTLRLLTPPLYTQLSPGPALLTQELPLPAPASLTPPISHWPQLRSHLCLCLMSSLMAPLQASVIPPSTQRSPSPVLSLVARMLWYLPRTGVG